MSLEQDGCERWPALLAETEVLALRAALDGLRLEPGRGGVRRVERLLPEVAALARSGILADRVAPYVGGPPRLVRAIYFDKTPHNNWLVAWHQDRTVAVSRRFEAEGWGPWSIKVGVWHVQPPLTVLQSMLTLRVHLDETTARNGCLKVIRGSHRHGVLDAAALRAQVDAGETLYCEAGPGDVLAMRPHLLHASEKAVCPGRRRVLHFEYSAWSLPEGVDWAA